MQACKPKKGSVLASPWGNYKKLPKPKLSLNRGWPLNWKGWPKTTRTSDLGWLRDKRTNGPGWLSRWTLLSGRSFLRRVGLIQWGFFHSFSPVLVPHAQWVKHSLPSPLQNLRALLPEHWQAAQHVGSALFLQFPLHWTSQQLALKWATILHTCPWTQSQRMGLLPLQHTWRSKQQEDPYWHWRK